MIQGPVVILANGDFPSHLISLGKLQDAQTIICCDGSVNNLVKNKMEPHYILGDLDSIDDNLKNKYRDRIDLRSVRIRGCIIHANACPLPFKVFITPQL